MSSRDNSEAYSHLIKEESTDEVTYKLLKNYSEFFELYPDEQVIDMDTFYPWLVNVRHPTIKPKIAEMYFKILTKALATDLTSKVAEDIIKHYKNVSYATQIANAAMAIETHGANSQTQMDSIQTIMSDYAESISDTTTDIKSSLEYMNLEDDILGRVNEAGIYWRMKELNVSVGPLRKGDFGIIAARVEVGKTAFMLSEVSHMAAQLSKEHPVLICSNEEKLSAIKKRAISSVLNKTLKDLYKESSESIRQQFSTALGDTHKVCFYYNAAMTTQELSRVFKAVQPGLIVIDQLDNVGGFKGDREDIALGNLYRWARKQASLYCPVLAVSQVDASGDGQKFLSMAQLDGAKTRKQAAADLIILIGYSYEAGEDKSRWINIRKNKLDGDKNTLESLRHATHEVTIDAARARYIGVMK